MIRRNNFFKKVFAGSIVALQITAIAPVYTVLAANVPTPVEDSTAKNNGIDEKAKEDKKAEEDKKALEKYYKDIMVKQEKLKHDRGRVAKFILTLRSDNITNEEINNIQHQLYTIKETKDKLKSDIETLKDYILSITLQMKKQGIKKSKEIKDMEKHIQDIEDSKRIMYCAELEIEEIQALESTLENNKEKVAKIKLDLKSHKLTEEERQTLQDQLNNMEEHNEKLYHDILKHRVGIYIEKLLMIVPDEWLR